MPATLADDIADSLAETVRALGDIPLYRIRRNPPPGTATRDDVLRALAEPRKRICELIDGILVEKAMAYRESLLASYLISLLVDFVRLHRLGLVTGEQGMMTLWPGRIRIPDVAFVSWDRLPGRRVPDDPIPEIGPDLAVEILSPSNTAAEMELKRRDYFRTGCRLVWIIEPDQRIAHVYKSIDQSNRLTENDILDGGVVLPGFRLPLKDFFGELDQTG